MRGDNGDPTPQLGLHLGRIRNAHLHTRLLIPAIISACIIVSLAVVPAEAQSYTAVLTLDHIPSEIRTGDTVIFSGRLTTTSNDVIGNAAIYIKDDVSFGRDKVIKTAFTDDRGKFKATWTAKPRSSGSWDFYASYDGESYISKARSHTYSVDVSSHYSSSSRGGSSYGGGSGSSGSGSNSYDSRDYSTSITLNRVPSPVYVGDTVTFTGRLASGGGPLQNAVVKIMEDDPFVPDQLLGHARTDNNGKFSITYRVSKGIETDFDVYATFDGYSPYEKSKTANQEMRVYAKKDYPTRITLDKIPTSVYPGYAVTFTGRLVYEGGPLQNAVVKIMEHDPLYKDQTLATGKTGKDGRFSIPWTADAGLFETDFEVYATFGGHSQYKKSWTAWQGMSVYDKGEYPSRITLDRIPDMAYAGDTVTFTGRLTGEWGPLKNTVVKIMEDDPAYRDQMLVSGKTNHDGRFSIPWEVDAGLFETDFDVYAAFDGGSSYEKSWTARQEMGVYEKQKRGGSISLDPIPRKASIGDQVTFSGTLSLDGSAVKGSVVYVKDDDTLRRDDLLAAAYVDEYGRFSTSWTAVPVDPLNTAGEIFAVFEGDAHNKRLVTRQQKIDILEYVPKQPTVVPKGDVYMEIYWNKQFQNPPRVAIIPHPDEIDTVRKYIGSAQEGLQMWSNHMSSRYDGDWRIISDVVLPGQKISREPDIYMNLVTSQYAHTVADDREPGCIDWAGVAYGVGGKEPPDTPNTIVCTKTQGKDRPSADVARTAAHEFIHAMGMGHMFGSIADMMCSVEDGEYTCKHKGSRPNTPSTFNIDAVAASYGTDGFQYPNNNVEYKQKFRADGSNNYNNNDNVNRNKDPSNPCTRTDHSYDYYVDETISPDSYMSWTLCTPEISYDFTTDDMHRGFVIYLIPPEVDTGDFVSTGKGSYYTCEEYGTEWHSKSNTCGIEPGSKIILYNPEENTIRVTGWLQSDNVEYKEKLHKGGSNSNHNNNRNQDPSNPCTRTDHSYDYYVDETISPDSYMSWILCTPEISYDFTTDDMHRGFVIYLIPPDTDVGDFMNKGKGSYYTCEEYGTEWHSKSNTCGIEPGSKIILYNPEENTIRVTGWLQS